MATNTAENRSPSLANIMRRFVDRALRSVYTMMPGQVLDFDPKTQTATIQPLFKIPSGGGATVDLSAGVTEGDLLEDLPALPGVPIVFPRSKHARVEFRVDKGTGVMLVFSMFSLEKFLLASAGNSATIDPQDVRHHDLSDAVAIVGLFPTADAIVDFKADGLRLVNEPPNGKKTEVILDGESGDVVVVPAEGSFVKLGGADATEHVPLGGVLNAELDALVQSFTDNAATFVSTGVGPGVLSPAVVTAIATFKTNLANTIAQKARVL